jgi:hypothetical protein
MVKLNVTARTHAVVVATAIATTFPGTRQLNARPHRPADEQARQPIQHGTKERLSWMRYTLRPFP